MLEKNSFFGKLANKEYSLYLVSGELRLQQQSSRREDVRLQRRNAANEGGDRHVKPVVAQPQFPMPPPGAQAGAVWALVQTPVHSWI